MHYFSTYLSGDVLFGWVFFFFILSWRDLLLSSALGFLLEAMKPGLSWRYPCVAPVNPRLAGGEHWGAVFASRFAVPLLWP